MGKITIKELKLAAAAVAEGYKIEPSDAYKIIGYFNAPKSAGYDHQKIADILAGDLSSVPVSAKALGIKLNEIPKTPPGTKAKKKKEKKTEAVEKIDGEIMPADKLGELPDNVSALVLDCIESYCEANHIDDMSKERQPRWAAACMVVGRSIFKNSKILHNIEREKTHGGIIYDVGRVSELCDLWLILCNQYNKAPMIDDFADFAGVSDSWLYGIGSAEGLTPARSALLQKLKRAQERGLAGLIVDGRQNPTGALAALNHWHGWTQTREVIHTNGGSVPVAPSLPVFDTSAGLLTDGGEDHGGQS